MHLRRLKITVIGTASLGLVAFESLRHYVLHPLQGETPPHILEHFIALAALSVAVLVFTLMIFTTLQRMHGEVMALNEAAADVARNLSLGRVLERVSELARRVAHAPYASVYVERGSPHTVSSGALAPECETVAYPIVVKDAPVGELVVGLPPRRRRLYTPETLDAFATQAGIAIENARLYEQVQELVATRERVRIGMDLHDGVIQHLYALGLEVDNAIDALATDSEEAAALLSASRDGLQNVITEIRSYVHVIRDGEGSVDLQPALEHVAAEFSLTTLDIVVEGCDDVRLPATVATNVLQVIREAVANSLRHADASRVAVRATMADGELLVEVDDDGSGFDPEAPSTGLGLRNMRERAQWCHGTVEIHSAPGAGTAVRMRVPLRQVRRAEVRA